MQIEGRKEALREVKRSHPDYEKIVPEFWSDKQFVEAAIKAHGEAYQYASKELQLDSDILDKVIEKMGDYHCQLSIKDLAVEVRDDAEAMKKLLEFKSEAFEFASDRLKEDRDMVLYAVGISAKNYEYASEHLKKDREIALTAVLSDARAYNYIPSRLQKDEVIMLATISENVACFVFSKNPELCENKDFMKKAIEIDPDTLRYASNGLKADRDFMLGIQPHVDAVQGMGYGHGCLGAFSKDKEFILEAVKTNPSVVKIMDNDLKRDKDFIDKAISVNPKAKLYCDHDMAKPTKKFFMDFIKSEDRPKDLQGALADANAKKQAKELEKQARRAARSNGKER